MTRKYIRVQIEVRDEKHCSLNCNLFYEDSEEGALCPLGEIKRNGFSHLERLYLRCKECVNAEEEK